MCERAGRRRRGAGRGRRPRLRWRPLLGDGDEPAEAAALDPTLGDGPLLGKRYSRTTTSASSCCAAGRRGALTVDGRPLLVKRAKPLPSSD